MEYNDENWPRGTEPFFPNQVLHHLLIVIVVMAIFTVLVFFCPGLFIEKAMPADPSTTPAHLKPQWYFLAAYQTLKLFTARVFGSRAEALGIFTQMVFWSVILFLPFIDCSRERDLRKRKAFLAASIVIIALIIVISLWGRYS